MSGCGNCGSRRSEGRPRRAGRRGNLVWGESTYRVGYVDTDHPWRNQSIGVITAEPEPEFIAFIAEQNRYFGGELVTQGYLYINADGAIFTLVDGILYADGPKENDYSINSVGELVML
jgi:hypothetical protein